MTKYNRKVSCFFLTWKMMFAKLRSSQKWKMSIVPESLRLELMKNSRVCLVFRLSSDNKTSESKPLKITQILRSPMKIIHVPYKITQYMQCEKAKLEVYSLQPSLIVACFIAISQDTINVTHLLISSRTILEHRREQPEPG